MDKYMSFRLDWNRGVGPTWHHDFEMFSEEMAKEYALRLLQSEPGMQQATRIQLWNMDAQTSLLYGTPEIQVRLA
jgi:hypothetical protein